MWYWIGGAVTLVLFGLFMSAFAGFNQLDDEPPKKPDDTQ